jgi:hypothetical protein
LFREVITAKGEEDIFDFTVFKEEACFHWSRYVKSQKSRRVCSMTNQHEIKDTPLRD